MACAGNNTIAALLAGAIDATAARGLEAHLDDCPACRHLVAELGRGLSAVRPERVPPERMPRTGDTIGERYEIARVLGVGGMGIVYEAHDAKLARAVAIKVLRPDFVEELGAQLLAEAQAMARLQHPNIVAVHDVATHGSQLYVCMEYVAGETLRAWHGKPWRDVLAVYRAAGEGLAYVHRAQLVHLDFKPDNVLVDANGRARVSDFGVARIAHHAEAHCIVGTPGYMAPEQRRGEHVDARTDQYAFCASLREALGDARIPGWLARAIARGMAPQPRDRFATMDALLDALVPPPSKRRHVGAAIVLASAAVAIVATMAPRPVVTRTVPIEVVREQTTRAKAKADAFEKARATAMAEADARKVHAHDDGRDARRWDDEHRATDRMNRGHATSERSFNRARGMPSLATIAHALRTSSPSASLEATSFADVAKQIVDEPGPCDDGSVTTCSYLPPACPQGTVTATYDSCWTCANEETCEPLGIPRTCFDGVDRFTCPPAPPSPPKKPETVANGSGSGSDFGSGYGSGYGSSYGSGGSGSSWSEPGNER